MTSNKARSRAIRARMAATGEPYSVAARALPAAPPAPPRRTATITATCIRDEHRRYHAAGARWQLGGIGGDPFCLDAIDLIWPADVDEQDRATLLQLAQAAAGQRGWDVQKPPAPDSGAAGTMVQLSLVRNDLGLRLDRLPAQPPTLHTDPAARARQAELARLPKAELAARLRRGIRGPDGRVTTLVDGEPQRWRKDEVAAHIVRIERPDLPESLTLYNLGRLDQLRGTVQPTRLHEPDYKLGVAHAAVEPPPGPAEPQAVLAVGEPWLQARTWLAYWQAWLAANDDRHGGDEDVLDQALSILMDNQAAWLTQHLPAGCRWDYFADELVGPAGTVLPEGLDRTMRDVALGVERAADQLLEELFAEAR